jgi:Serine dehydrogenase proteinase
MDALFSAIIDETQPAGWTKRRQALLSELESKLGAAVVAYIASPQHPLASLIQQDIPLLVDLVTVARRHSDKVYLIIQSPGGDGHAAEKALQIYRGAFPDGFYVVIPQSAKSAATMISLGADSIVMGDSSELGPIDPQVQVPLPSGQVQLVPARAYLTAIETIRDRVRVDPTSIPVYYPILQQVKPEMIAMCADLLKFSEDFAKRWLPMGAMKGRTTPEIEATVRQLVAGGRFGLHGSVINHIDAKETLHLDVDYWPTTDDRWRILWEYYLRTIPLFLSNPANAKLFESTETSTAMAVQLIQMPNPGHPQPAGPPRGAPLVPPGPATPTPGVPRPSPSPAPRES